MSSEDMRVLRHVTLPASLNDALAKLEASRRPRLPNTRKIPLSDLFEVKQAVAAALCNGLQGPSRGRLERAWDKLNDMIGKPK